MVIFLEFLLKKKTRKRKKNSNSPSTGSGNTHSNTAPHPTATTRTGASCTCPCPCTCARAEVCTHTSGPRAAASRTPAGSMLDAQAPVVEECRPTHNSPTNNFSAEKIAEDPACNRAGASAQQRSKNTKISLPDLADDDMSYTLVSAQKERRRKRRAFHVGNLKDTTTDESISEFIQLRAQSVGLDVTVHNAQVYPKADGFDTVFARVLVDARHSHLMLTRSFWPGRLYCRRWKKRQPENKSEKCDGKGRAEEPEPIGTGNTNRSQANADDDSRDTIPLQNRYEILNEDPASARPASDEADELRLELSPESTWGDDEHAQLPASENADEQQSILAARSSDPIAALLTPRGKSRGHERVSPPDQLTPTKRPSVGRNDTATSAECTGHTRNV